MFMFFEFVIALLCFLVGVFVPSFCEVAITGGAARSKPAPKEKWTQIPDVSECDYVYHFYRLKAKESPTQTQKLPDGIAVNNVSMAFVFKSDILIRTTDNKYFIYTLNTKYPTVPPEIRQQVLDAARTLHEIHLFDPKFWVQWGIHEKKITAFAVSPEALTCKIVTLDDKTSWAALRYNCVVPFEGASKLKPGVVRGFLVDGKFRAVDDFKHTTLPTDRKKFETTITKLGEETGAVVFCTPEECQMWITPSKFPSSESVRFTESDRARRQLAFLKDSKFDLEALRGETGAVMTPYLRLTQMELFNDIPENGKLFDIGIGTGRSSKLWFTKKLEVWGVEPDQKNIDSLNRKNIPNIKEVKQMGGEDPEIQKWIEPESMDVVMMSYSLTFFFESEEKLENLVKNIRHVLKPGGLFIGVGLDGDAVDKWDLEKENPVFRIKKLYDKREPFGSKIEITMKNAFTLVDTQTEFLVDFDKFKQSFKDFKILKFENLSSIYMLGDWAEQFVKAQRVWIFKK